MTFDDFDGFMAFATYLALVALGFFCLGMSWLCMHSKSITHISHFTHDAI